MEAIQGDTDEWIAKQNAKSMYNGTFFNLNEEKNLTYNNMDNSGRHSKWNISQKGIYCIIPLIWCT